VKIYIAAAVLIGACSTASAQVSYYPNENIVKKQNNVERYYLIASKRENINRATYLAELDNTINRLKRARSRIAANGGSDLAFSQLPRAKHEIRFASGTVVVTLDGIVLGADYDDTIHRNVLLHFEGESTTYKMIIEPYDRLRATSLFYASSNCTGTFYSGLGDIAAISRSGEVLIPDVNSAVSVAPKSAFYKGECQSGEDYKYGDGGEYILYLYRSTDLVIEDTRIIWREL
jgi:hypothetical protein